MPAQQSDNEMTSRPSNDDVGNSADIELANVVRNDEGERVQTNNQHDTERGDGGESDALCDDANDSNDDDDDDDDMTVIVLDPSADDQGINGTNQQPQLTIFDWIEQSGAPEIESRRRHILLGELRRVQRSSFIQFMFLCIIPTVLLMVVLGTVLEESEECTPTPDNGSSYCYLEQRTFMNAFTTRCICESLPVARESNP